MAHRRSGRYAYSAPQRVRDDVRSWADAAVQAHRDRVGTADRPREAPRQTGVNGSIGIAVNDGYGSYNSR
ncbi:hypothetical protein MVAC_20278 [Mycolicibacterium vaccae ATCC 25954]|uniref:Uncharacterized protein n=1 Tax=Mycolicibacterium vaccae ATCC 25954 TaxID=1194972 RepID=K0UPH2_MYCVA|nr:hypothetical protein MVAC_20278 [Mycolicibacterium vaccae ATCC 25954]